MVILDIDAHHGDGVENLTADNPMVLTYSIHEKGIFPGTGNESDPDRNIYNYPLPSVDDKLVKTGKGDDALRVGVSHFINVLDFHFSGKAILVSESMPPKISVRR